MMVQLVMIVVKMTRRCVSQVMWTVRHPYEARTRRITHARRRHRDDDDDDGVTIMLLDGEVCADDDADDDGVLVLSDVSEMGVVVVSKVSGSALTSNCMSNEDDEDEGVCADDIV